MANRPSKVAYLKVQGAVRIYIRAAGITGLSLDLRDASIAVIHEGTETNIGFENAPHDMIVLASRVPASAGKPAVASKPRKKTVEPRNGDAPQRRKR